MRRNTLSSGIESTSKVSTISLLILVVAIITFGAWGPGANAIPILRLSTGTDVVTITDGGVGDINPIQGAVAFIGSLGDWALNLSSGISMPFAGTPIIPVVDVSSLNAGSGSLTIAFTDTGFGPFPAGYYFQSNIGGVLSPGGSLDFATYLDPSNASFGQDILLTNQDFSSGNTFTAFSGTAGSGPISPPTPYSLTEVITLTHPAAGGLSSFNATVTAVPEPTTLLLLGSGLFGVGIAIRRRFKK